MSSLRETTIKAMLWKLLERGGAQVVNLVVQIVLARVLGPENFGLLAIMLVFTNVCTVFVQSGLGTALIQSDRTVEKDYSTVFWTSLVISLVLSLALIAVSQLVSELYEAPSLVWPLRAMSLLIVLNSLSSVLIAKAQREFRFQKMCLASLVGVVTSGGIGVACAVLECGLWSLVAQQVLYQLVYSLVLAVSLKWRPVLHFSLSRAMELYGYSWKLLVASLLTNVYQGINDLLVGKAFSSTQLGFFNQGKKIPFVIESLFDQSIQAVMLPAFSRLQSDLAKVKGALRRAVSTSSFVVAFAMGYLAIAANSLVPVLFGDEWLDSVPFLQVFCIAYVVWPVSTSNLQALNAVGRSDLYLKLEVVKDVIGLVLVLVACFVFGNALAVAIAFCLYGYIAAIVNAFPGRRILGYKLREQLSDVLPCYALAAFAAAVSLIPSIWIGQGLRLAVIQLVIMGLAYISVAKLLKFDCLAYCLSAFKGILLKHR